MKAYNSILRFWPIGILLLLEAILFAANYTPGTWLMGWDNVMPELNLRQAIATNIFGVWQEHRGLGLYDGMGHAANLVHTLLLWLLSLALPAGMLRYSFHFLMHLAGGFGIYLLLKNLIDKQNAAAKMLSITRWIALAGALFYQYNLATIQMFYTPLEAFSVHFASLPWLAWSALGYLTQPSRKTFLTLLLISFLSTPQFFITTLLLPVGILMGALSIPYIAKKPFSVFLLTFSFFLVNAFWLLPYLYGIPHNAPVIKAAKINQMSSDEVFARNRAFGDLGNVLRLRGFPLDFEDTAADGTPTFLMAPWRAFLTNPFIDAGSWIVVGIILIGLASFARHSLVRLRGFILMFASAFLLLANDAPIIKDLTLRLRDTIPMFAEAYRFPFTKFSLLFAFSSSVFFAIGLAALGKRRIIPAIGAAVVFLLALPAFGGNFFSDRLRVPLPDDYLRVFAFMKDKPPGRIAYLPQHQYWSWKYYRWGYRGSGFLWYGISQPILDRAFDPWSGYNENYYWEISRSIYSKDALSLLAIFRKYDVRYILLDENLISTSHNRALYTDEIKEMLGEIGGIREIWSEGKLTLYEATGTRSNQFITLMGELPTVFPAYRWTDNDAAYREVGDYISTSQPTTNNVQLTTFFYPFRSLFTKRSVSEREFTVTETADSITIGSLVEATGASMLKADAIVYDSTKSADLLAKNVKTCGVLREGAATTQNIDGALRFISRNQRGCLSFGLGNLPHTDGYLVAVESRHISGRPLLFSLISDTARHVEVETYLQPEKARPFQAKTAYFILPPLAPDGLGYSAYLSNDAIGRQETVNDIKSIKVYRIPYQELAAMRTGSNPRQSTSFTGISVSHPNPAFYRVGLGAQDGGRTEGQTLVLFQSFDPGWAAFQKTDTFPYLRPLKDHALVNNWANGWKVDGANEIVIFFWPQVLQWLGFALLPIPFLGVYWKKVWQCDGLS